MMDAYFSSFCNSVKYILMPGISVMSDLLTSMVIVESAPLFDIGIRIAIAISISSWKQQMTRAGGQKPMATAIPIWIKTLDVRTPHKKAGQWEHLSRQGATLTES